MSTSSSSSPSTPKKALRAAVGPARQARQALRELGEAVDKEALTRAASSGNVAVIKLHLQAGVPANSVVDGTPVLHYAAAGDGGVDAVSVLLDGGVDPDTRDADGRTALMLPGVSPTVARFLLQRGASPVAKDENECAPLHVAAARRDVELAGVLLEAGADPNDAPWGGETPLKMAAALHCRPMVQLLLRHGADPGKGQGVVLASVAAVCPRQSNNNNNNNNISSPARLSSSPGNTPSNTPRSVVSTRSAVSSLGGGGGGGGGGRSDFEAERIVSLLLAASPAAADETDELGDTPLHLAARLAMPITTCTLLGVGADVNARNHAGESPLHVAAGQGIVEMLLEGKADVNACCADGATPLHYALRRGSVKDAEALVAAGADVHARDGAGDTPLAVSPSVGAVDLLLRHGAVPEVAALHAAVSTSNSKVAQRMLQAGAPVNGTSGADGETALHAAVRQQDMRLVCLLLNEYCADINAAREADGLTPLHLAAEAESVTFVSLLLRKNANRLIKDKLGRRPLQLADKKEVQELLRRPQNAAKQASHTGSVAGSSDGPDKRRGSTVVLIAADGKTAHEPAPTLQQNRLQGRRYSSPAPPPQASKAACSCAVS